MQTLVDDAARVVEGWRRGPVVFMGLSMGGMVAQGLGIGRPELVRGLVLANTTSVYPAAAKAAWAQRIATVRAGGMEAVADLVVQRYLSEEFRSANPLAAARLGAKVLANDPESYAACCEAVAEVDWAEELHRIACPTLVLAGALDAGATPEMAQAIASRIAGARLQVLERASHLSVEEQPEAFHAAVEDFLAAIETKEHA
jgi:3-oxoadipate enol-lactonase